jgi:hypothetical protein
MTKKFKIKDLEDDSYLPMSKAENESRVIEKIVDIDKLPDEVEILKAKVLSSDTVSPSLNSKVETEKLVYFERNLIVSYFSKAFSTLVVLICLELVSHFMKFFDEVNVLNTENFHSLFFSGEMRWVLCKIVGILILVYFISNKDQIVLNKKGLYCVKPEITDTIFFTPKNIFIPWEKMASVELKMRLFEPYLCFYDSKETKLGHLEFSIAAKDKFFTYVERHAGKDHPLYKIKESLLLV